jgi:AcrR family transcriptional regulator
MLAAALRRFRRDGYDATGLRDVVADAAAARGAIYHHFPRGKAQLGTEVAEAAGRRVAAQVEQACRELPAAAAVDRLLDVALELLVRTDGVPGCPVAAVTLSAHDPGGELRDVADRAFGLWQEHLAACLARDGAPPERAQATAALCVAAVEGAVLLCRASGDEGPFHRVAAEVRLHVADLLAAAA